jgi:iron complex transport system permease protein
MRRSDHGYLAGLGLLLLLAIWLAGGVGSRNGQLMLELDWIQQAFAAGPSLQREIIVSWRVPRVASALVVGAALALAGLLLQGVTRNPLADPYLLGISGGAGLAVVLLHSISGLPVTLAWWSMPLAAFVGALAAMAAVMVLSRGSGGRLSTIGMILAGVVINALCAAVMTFLLARFDPFRLRVTSSWLAGGIGFSHWAQLVGVGAIVLGAALWLRASAHRLNAFALGEGAAGSVGVDVSRLTRRSAIIASLLAAVGVSLAGLLGYIGLILPHAVRLLVGSDFRKTVPLAALGGAFVTLLADTGARVLFAPEELPVGVLTAIVGCPLLLWQLRAQLRTNR